jgi:protein transport protein HofB
VEEELQQAMLSNLDINSTQHDNISDLVGNIIKKAIKLNVSDIHFNIIDNDKVAIKFRVDSILHNVSMLRTCHYYQLLTHIKVLSNLDITKHKTPQDGTFKVGKNYCRINICPTMLGSRTVIRIIKELKIKTIENIGFTPAQAKLVKLKLKRKSGMILTVGPTGSGKTVTLYHLLAHLQKQNLNILTVCDPVEIELPEIHQTSLEHKLNLDYPTILKAFLRQDPDIIMIGEIRDAETLSIAIQAATTGHLVLSSIHTLDVLSAISRLNNLGVKTDTIYEIVTLVIGQRLIRKRCTKCTEYCENCISGYSGQTAIYETLDLTKKNFSVSPSLDDIANNLVKEGITDIKEVNRVMGSKV